MSREILQLMTRRSAQRWTRTTPTTTTPTTTSSRATSTSSARSRPQAAARRRPVAHQGIMAEADCIDGADLHEVRRQRRARINGAVAAAPLAKIDTRDAAAANALRRCRRGSRRLPPSLITPVSRVWRLAKHGLAVGGQAAPAPRVPAAPRYAHRRGSRRPPLARLKPSLAERLASKHGRPSRLSQGLRSSTTPPAAAKAPSRIGVARPNPASSPRDAGGRLREQELRREEEAAARPAPRRPGGGGGAGRGGKAKCGRGFGESRRWRQTSARLAFTPRRT